MGRDADPQVREEYGLVDSKPLQDYINTIGQRLAAVSHRPNIVWHFVVVNSPVVNAFAIPGGYVYFTRGILAYMNSEAELAGVMGHEIGHVTARHSVRQMTRAQLAQIGLGVGTALSPTFGQLGGLAETGLGLVFLKNGRDAERESDRLGVEYAAKGGYDPREIGGFFEVLQRLSEANDRETIPGWLSTHPDPPERVATTAQLARQWVSDLRLADSAMTVGRPEHLELLNGLIFGDNPREGFFEDGHFYHPDLNFQLEFPRGWKVENTRQSVVALEPTGAAAIQLSFVSVPEGTTADAYVRQLAERGVRPIEGEMIQVNGNRAFLGTFPTGPTTTTLVAFVEYNRRLYQIAGSGDSRRFGAATNDSIRSFSKLMSERARNARPDRIRLHRAVGSETLSELAVRFDNPRMDAQKLAVLNRFAPDQRLAAGTVVKVVERGY